MRPLALLLLLAGVACAPPVTVTTDAKPGQAEAVALALGIYGAAGTPSIAWAEGWQLTCQAGTGFFDPRVAGECLGGSFDVANGQVWVAWPAGAQHVRDVAGDLAHELAHFVRPEVENHDHPWFRAGGAVEQAAAAIAAMEAP